MASRKKQLTVEVQAPYDWKRLVADAERCRYLYSVVLPELAAGNKLVAIDYRELLPVAAHLAALEAEREARPAAGQVEEWML